MHLSSNLFFNMFKLQKLFYRARKVKDLCVIHELEWFPINIFIFNRKWNLYSFLGFDIFCKITAISTKPQWSLYDQEFIQIIYDLGWLLKVINDLIQNQIQLNDRWPERS